MPGWHGPCSFIFMSTSFPLPQALAREPEHPLARAFASFTEAAGSLERAYCHLQGEVAHLRQELEVTNRDLASSLEENRRIRERLRRILEGLPCGVLVIEAGKIEMVESAAGTRVCALNPEAVRLLGGNFETVAEFPVALAEALDGARQMEEESELPLCNLKPSALDPSAANPNNPGWVAIRHAWLEQSEAGPTSVFILRDVSEAKKLERDREHLRRQQALVEMSALLAHEIRNPLGSLELFAGLLAEANLEGESRRWIEHVQAGLRTLSATVNNVLNLHNTPQPELAATDAGELLDWAYDFLLPLAKQARVEMQLINNLHGVAIQADRHRLEQVLLNLALNAFRFMPGGGWLSLRGREGLSAVAGAASSKGADSIEIEVRDTGPGIAPDDLPRIFEAGFSTRPGSSGLGLAVCHRVIEQHGGLIEAESVPGQGATFRLRLPRNRANAETGLSGFSCQPMATSTTSTAGLHVLQHDDAQHRAKQGAQL
jgi:two-component system sensor histidine kinase FlrB